MSLIRIALPLGRLNDKAIEIINKYLNLNEVILKDMGSRIFIIKNENYEFYFLKPKDILRFINLYKIDYAVISNDYYCDEFNNDYKILESKKFGIQKISLIGKDMCLDNIKTIVTPYIDIAKKFFPNKEILEFNSSLEIYPNINKEIGIIDVIETGNTIKKHDLYEIQKIMDLEILLIKKQ